MTLAKSSAFLLILVLFVITGGAKTDQEEEGFCLIDQQTSQCNNYQTINKDGDSKCFRAAVYEHNRVDLSDGLKTVEANLDIFEQVARLAGEHGANILVFPEDGLFMGDREYINPLLSIIPDPELLDETNNNACLHVEFYKSSSILRRLSCMARENNLYLVANFGTKQLCNNSIDNDEVCPDVGYLALNTNIVLDPRGNFIKRYRKHNLFIEVFDKTPSLETVYFDTPSFGRFGVFTCFDMMFKRPAVELVERFHINTAIFPTWWYDELPFLTAIQFQEGWSETNKVNLLASNLHKLNLGSTGSGIFSNGYSTYVGFNSSKSKLLIADLPVNYSSQTSSNCLPTNAKILDIETEQDNGIYKYKNYSLLPSDSVHLINEREGQHTVCNKQVCCTIDYKISSSIDLPIDRIALIVRDGQRPGRYNWYEQVCALATLNSPLIRDQLDKTSYSMEGIVSFERLNLKGTFNSKYVYPITAHNACGLVNRNSRRFNCDDLTLGSKETNQEHDKVFVCKLELAMITDETINSFGMYGRLYENDTLPTETQYKVFET